MRVSVVWLGQFVEPLAVGPGLILRASTVFLEGYLSQLNIRGGAWSYFKVMCQTLLSPDWEADEEWMRGG